MADGGSFGAGVLVGSAEEKQEFIGFPIREGRSAPAIDRSIIGFIWGGEILGFRFESEFGAVGVVRYGHRLAQVG